MKSKLLLIAFIFLLVQRSTATIVVVTISGTSFSPASLIVNPGDSIKWVVGTGSHNTISAVIPSGAAPWNSPLDGTTPFFIYIPAVPGDYTYRCDIHGEAGAFTVTTPTEVKATVSDMFYMAPNPASGKLHVQFTETKTPATVSITDFTGRSVFRKELNSSAPADLDLTAMPAGNYIITATQGTRSTTQLLRVDN